MSEVTIRVLANLFSNNEFPYKIFSKPESRLLKKYNGINYHVCCEAVAAGITSVVKEDTHTNPDDAFTILMPYIKKQGFLGGIILWGY